MRTLTFTHTHRDIQNESTEASNVYNIMGCSEPFYDATNGTDKRNERVARKPMSKNNKREEKNNKKK